MKSPRSIRTAVAGLLAPIAIILVSTVNSSAQGGVIVANNTVDNLRICFYNPGDLVRMVAIRCEKISAKSEEWVRLNQIEYQIRVFKDQLIDKQLYWHRVRNAEKIDLGPKRAKITRRPIAGEPVEYTLKVCNTNNRDPVYFILGFEHDSKMHLRGWWSVRKGKCKEFNVARMMWSDWRIRYGTVPRTYYYARTYGREPLIWSGKDTDKQACIDKKNAFKHESKLAFPYIVGDYWCSERSYLMEVRLRSIDPPRANQKNYSLTF